MPVRTPKKFEGTAADQYTGLSIISFDRVEAVL